MNAIHAEMAEQYCLMLSTPQVPWTSRGGARHNKNIGGRTEGGGEEGSGGGAL